MLTALHKFEAAGTVTLRCIRSSGDMYGKDIKLTAIEVPKLRNQAF